MHLHPRQPETRHTLHRGDVQSSGAHLATSQWNTGGFTSKYRVFRLVHAEFFDDMTSAIGREKQLKNWRRDWKINLIEGANPEWRDLAGLWRIAEPVRHGS